MNILDYNDLCAHSIYGQSWEGFVIEQILQNVPYRTEASFYRSSGGAEIDLVLELPNNKCWAIEIKRTIAPRISRGFHSACEEIAPDKRFYVVPTKTQYPLDEITNAIGVEELIHNINDKS